MKSWLIVITGLLMTISASAEVDPDHDGIAGSTPLHSYQAGETGPPVGDLLAVEWASISSPVWRIDSQTGAGNMIGLSGYPRLNGLGRTSTGTHYSVDRDEDRLIIIDPLTGAGEEVAVLDFGGIDPDVRGLAFSAADELYVIHRDFGVTSSLYHVDVATGAGTHIGQMSAGIQGLAFAPDGTLYGWWTDPSGDDRGLVTIDLETGTVTDVDPDVPAEGETPIGSCQTLFFDPAGALFCGGVGIYSVDLSTGAVSPIGGDDQGYYIYGAEFVAGTRVIPALSPVGLLLLGSLLAGVAWFVFLRR